MTIAVNRGRFADQFRRLFGIKGHIGLNLLTDVMPTIDVLGEYPENFFERDEALGQAAGTVGAGGAGTFGYHLVYNGSPNRVIVIEHCDIDCASLVGVSILQNVAGPLAAGDLATGVQDSRWLIPGSVVTANRVGTAQYKSATVAATVLPGNQTWYSWEVGVRTIRSLPYIIGPGAYFYVQCAIANTALSASIAWREREFESIN